ncbi:aa_trans domain-containing protein [Caerostris darwini]|uniref:Aa_trans domain-containing protein n=1 Tax=Caerostris darwini TaxID=1538125 RepID=A0AAV4X1N4_9ARAC|nr:aa_trans domain-containing protein [Caerostris darwini]
MSSMVSNLHPASPLLPTLLFGHKTGQQIIRHIYFPRCLPVINVLSAVFFVFLCLIAFFMDKEKIGPVQYREPTLGSFAFSFGVIMYSYGGASLYPTIQNDMRNQKLFPQSLFTAFLGKV